MTQLSLCKPKLETHTIKVNFCCVYNLIHEMKRGGKGKDNKKDKMNDKGGKKESEAKIQKPSVGKVRFLLAFVLCMLTTA